MARASRFIPRSGPRVSSRECELRVRRARRHSQSRIAHRQAEQSARVGQRMTMMAATSDERSVMEPGRRNSGQSEPVDRLKLLYPMVNEEETPLPRSWSTRDKYNYIGLSQNNLRVHYKGTWIKARVRARDLSAARRCVVPPATAFTPRGSRAIVPRGLLSTGVPPPRVPGSW